MGHSMLDGIKNFCTTFQEDIFLIYSYIRDTVEDKQKHLLDEKIKHAGLRVFSSCLVLVGGSLTFRGMLPIFLKGIVSISHSMITCIAICALGLLISRFFLDIIILSKNKEKYFITLVYKQTAVEVVNKVTQAWRWVNAFYTHAPPSVDKKSFAITENTFFESQWNYLIKYLRK